MTACGEITAQAARANASHWCLRELEQVRPFHKMLTGEVKPDREAGIMHAQATDRVEWLSGPAGGLDHLWNESQAGYLGHVGPIGEPGMPCTGRPSLLLLWSMTMPITKEIRVPEGPRNPD